MKKLLTIVIIIAIIGGAYYLLTTENDSVNPEQDTDTATSTDETATSTADEVDDENEDDNATSTDDKTATAYCAELKSNISGSEDWHIITNIIDGATIQSGDEIRGCVYSVNDSYNNWAPFEGQIGSYEVTATDGTSLGMGALPTAVEGDWMAMATAGEALRYQNTMEFDAAGYTEGTLVIRNENAAGLPEMDQSVEIDVVFE
jgi:hypothetical protein